jgi:hypothetical protein
MLNAFMSAALAMTEQKGEDNTIAYHGDGVREFNNFMQYAFTDAMRSVEKIRPDFKVKTPIVETKPVEAKIGTKEGLKRKQRYEVYEGELNPATNEIKSKYVGTVRAAKIAKNNDTTSVARAMTSKFATVFQKKPIQPHMFIEQKNDKTTSLYLDMSSGGGTSIYAFGLQNMNFITRYSLSGSLMMDLCLMRYNDISSNYDYYNYSYSEISKTSTSYYLRLGYAFGINLFHPNIKFSPFGMGGIGQSSEGLDSFYSYGGKLSYSLSTAWQIYFKTETITAKGVDAESTLGGGIQYSF